MHLCICCFVLCYLPKLKRGMALVFSAIVFYKDIKTREEGIMLIIVLISIVCLFNIYIYCMYLLFCAIYQN